MYLKLVFHSQFLYVNLIIVLFIKNIRSIYCVEYNHYDRYKNSTELHIIIDSNNILIIYEFFTPLDI